MGIITLLRKELFAFFVLKKFSATEESTLCVCDSQS